jgi:hypothetical protein
VARAFLPPHFAARVFIAFMDLKPKPATHFKTNNNIKESRITLYEKTPFARTVRLGPDGKPQARGRHNTVILQAPCATLTFPRDFKAMSLDELSKKIATES